jgi:DNA mismatch repair protein MutS
MVEMVETAAILNQADDRALVILDEIGRGTATFDGLSIAWATVEHLHEVNRCRAPVRHALPRTDGAGRKAGRLSNATMAVKEWEGEVIFLHEVRPARRTGPTACRWRKLAGLAAIGDRPGSNRAGRAGGRASARDRNAAR